MGEVRSSRCRSFGAKLSVLVLLAGALSVLPAGPASAATTTFAFTGALQTFTVPAGVTSVTITAVGAQGGDVRGISPSPGGRGASIQGQFSVTPAETLSVVVGGAGAGGFAHGGGGGGSFVWRGNGFAALDGSSLLVAAGGGGGAAFTAGSDASLLTAGTAGGGADGGAGGTGGNGGGAGTRLGGSAAGGGGIFSGGGSSHFVDGSVAGVGGQAIDAGAAGGSGHNNGNGGFGGGGGAAQGMGAGGGGYSGGGGAGQNGGSFPGGGGGSYNAGTSPVNTAGVGTGNGQVTITYTEDTTPPSVTVAQAGGQADPTQHSPINFTATFSEEVTGFTGSDVSFTGSTAGGTLVANVTGGPTIYNIAVTGMTTGGTVLVSIPAGAATDLAGNPSLASSPADNSVAWQVDTTPPTCFVSALRAGPPKQMDVTVQDTGSGLAAINRITITNGTVSVQPFTPGTTAPVVVTATKTDRSQPTRWNFWAVDMAGNEKFCDPIDLDLSRTAGKPEVVTAADLPGTAHLLTVVNANPGITNLRVEVNGSRVANLHVDDGEERTIDIGAHLRPGDDNTVVLTATGKPEGSATVIIHN